MSRVYFLMLGLACACGGSDSNAGDDKTPPTPPPVLGGDVDGGLAAGDGCSDAAKLVYVFTEEGDIYSFAPADKKFAKLGPPKCSASEPVAPISMAVDRNANAYLNGQAVSDLKNPHNFLFKMDTKTLTCTQTPIQGQFGGMGFSTQGTSTEERLYLGGVNATHTSSNLHYVDFTANTDNVIGEVGIKSVFELTGTGDGRLYGFFVNEQPPKLAQIDKASGATSNVVPLTNLERPDSPLFAFSFWGGDFYFYTATVSHSTNVTRYRPSDGSLDTAYMTNIGFHIVGAGVSTCAPITAPR